MVSTNMRIDNQYQLGGSYYASLIIPIINIANSWLALPFRASATRVHTNLITQQIKSIQFYPLAPPCQNSGITTILA